MAIVTGSPRKRVAAQVSTYVVLGFFAFIMLFPFMYLVGSSLKQKDAVFSYPPTVLPRAAETVEIDGEPAPLYVIEGEQRALVGTSDLGVYAPPDDLDATVQVPTRDVDPTGGFTNPESVTIDGEEQDLFDVPVDGQIVPMIELDTITQARFANPGNPDDITLGSERAAEPVERLSAQFSNYAEVLSLQSLDRSLSNTLLVTILVVMGTVFTSIIGGYAFARIDFPGRDTMFLVYIGSIMVPFVIIIVPLYQLMVAIGWVNTLASLIFPFVFNAYGTFLMRQFFVSLPKDLEEAAFIDGASRWTILWRIFLPLSTPAIAALATFMFLYSWNSFVWPFVVINAGNTENHVLTLSLQILGGRAADSPNLVFAGVGFAVVLPVVVFVLLQRYFVENVATSGIK